MEQKVFDEFLKTLRSKGFNEQQANEALNGLFQIIIQASFNEIVEELGEGKAKDVFSQVEMSKKENNDPIKVFNSFISEVNKYLPEEKIKEIISREANSVLTEFANVINK